LRSFALHSTASKWQRIEGNASDPAAAAAALLLPLLLLLLLLQIKLWRPLYPDNPILETSSKFEVLQVGR
jgi:hypothetical protein